jgi:parvulin-like peptidyl-prolyl isomerase
MAMGLDRDDTLIRRHLRLRMEALADGIGPREPADEELRQYLAAHEQSFRAPPRYTFKQIYLNPAQRGSALDRDVAALLERLTAADTPADAAAVGDRTLLDHSMEDADERDVAAQFGESFAASLARLPTDMWQGPVRSGYGVHLVLLVDRVEGRTPPFDEIRHAVAREWSGEQTRIGRERFYRALRREYLVTLDRRATQRDR